ncbi:MAG: putative metalloendopeptidase [Chitinophagaceae bacterium]|nr:putative metalloendopeptidase [Chitinophagaceae bacterium]
MRKLTILSFFIAPVIFYSCQPKPTVTEQQYLTASDHDTTVKPGDNFYMYANGAWIKKAVIPPTETQTGGFYDLYLRTQDQLKTLVEDAAKGNHASGSIEQKVGDFYTSAMDSATIEKAGYEPLKPVFQQIDSLKTPADVMHFVAQQHTNSNNILFTLVIGADEKNSSMNIPVFYQGGLGLPDRDYYFKTDAATQKVVKAYQTYMQKLFALTGDDSLNANNKMTTVFLLEKKLAGSHRTNVELRNPQANYNKMAVSSLDQNMPSVGWKDLLNNMMIKTDSVNVGQPGFYSALNDLLKSVPVDTWKTYLKFHIINDYANDLSSPFVNARFEYAGKTLSGQQQIKPRWQRMIDKTDNELGEALGELYVKKYFSADAKKRMEELVGNLSKAFEARMDKLDWMTDTTKQIAKDKLHLFLRKIGYPDKWKDYSRVQIKKDKYFDNLVSADKNAYAFQVNKVGKPVDRTEWGMTPPTINAYYNPTFNEIVFPAGILQFPFFDANADDAVNYGGIGMVIGHEMTHGFDDQGAQYDKEGNMKNWWSKTDAEKFKTKGDAVVNLYNSFTVLDTVHVNGKLTLGENMADIGGLAIAYDAFKLTKQGQGNEKIDGLTPDQRFFLSFAQIWKSKIKDESVRFYVNVDPHSPDMYRVLGPLMNFTPFYNAFNVKPGDKMYKADSARIKIW